MDLSESTKRVYSRIQKLEPEHATKIIGYLLLQENGNLEMLRLVFSPDNVIQSLINKAKAELDLSRPAVSTPISSSQVNSFRVLDIPLQYTLYSPAPRPICSPVHIGNANTIWDTQVPAEQQSHNLDFFQQEYTDRMQLLALEDQLDCVDSVSSDFSSNYYQPEPAFGLRTSRRSPSLPEFPLKVCHYYNKGFCKHGNNCRYFHGNPMPESFSKSFRPSSIEVAKEDHAFSSGSLEKLEMELTELLKSRRGFPVSIASLPMLYYEKYGRTLQAEGYLTESQRHGKAGYSLTKLLARLKNSICLIDRPHGQHSVILADLPKYLEHTGDRADAGGIVAGSRQIYLTFPAESTFTEQDVSNYFNKFGPVQDVRIPCQQKRMFGFVTFVYAETVKQILAKGNPHFVCGARVLVKPYREKIRFIDRKYSDKIQHVIYGPRGDSEFHSMPRVYDNSRLLRKHLIEEHEQALEIERRLSEMQIASGSLINHPYFGYTTDDLKLSEGRAQQPEFPTAERFNYFLDVLNNDSSNDDGFKQMNTNYNDQDCNQGLNLPDSPFASPIRNGISTVI